MLIAKNLLTREASYKGHGLGLKRSCGFAIRTGYGREGHLQHREATAAHWSSREAIKIILIAG
jgi:hypothetical protein